LKDVSVDSAAPGNRGIRRRTEEEEEEEEEEEKKKNCSWPNCFVWVNQRGVFVRTPGD
jgi:hypothetical protein